MNHAQNCIDYILSEIPSFAPRWHAYLEYWEDSTPGLCSDVSEFSHYVIDLIKENEKPKNLANVFYLIESLLVDGDNEVKNAAATCFLENLLNVSSEEKIEAKQFVPFLGKESRVYCKSWDTFTGVHTDGL